MKSYGRFKVKFWPIFSRFYPDLSLIFSNHVIIVANFEKIFILSGFIFNFGKVAKFQRISSKSYGQKPLGRELGYFTKLIFQKTSNNK